MKMNYRLGTVLVLFVLLFLASAPNVFAQKHRSVVKSKQRVILVGSTDSSTGCVSYLNPKAALELPQPKPVKIADGSILHGKVSVRVLIGEDGKVISAAGESGDERLKAEAVVAALLAMFRPTLLRGKPVKVSGLVWYTF